ncbi:MAG: N-acetyl-gamma-glutamyl-phosphate reductase [Acholeplasmatales bacterium]|nr:N-acetyl-gamma-glutamyl-phosphate reductase [Acholeplasmatales bacterium]
MFKVYIDGQSGTTGLRINERLSKRPEIEILKISEEKRHDEEERKKFINAADVVFLCLPDDAAIEAVKLCTNPNTVIIDASTAHRTNPMWAYGFPELDKAFLEKLKGSKRIANPGCYASGFMSIAYPLVHMGIAGADYPFAANAISGYSGAGKKGIAQYEDKNRSEEFDAPRLYAMSMAHKHLPEMQVIAGLKEKPLFNPYVCDFLEGMLVTIPLYTNRLTKKYTVKEIHDLFEDYYKGQDFVRVMPLTDKGTEDGFLSAAHLAGKDYMEIYFAGNDDRINITCALDNLGKGASGAAIESMNIVLGLDPKTGLEM